MPTGPAQNYMRQAFHGSNNQASHGTPWLRRIPGRAVMCSARGPESVRANVMSARAASRCISCQTGCIGSDYRPCGTSVESHCSTGMHPLLSITIEAVTREKNREDQTTGESELANRKKGYLTRRTLLKDGAAMTAMPVLGIAAPSVLAQRPLKSPTRVQDFMTNAAVTKSEQEIQLVSYCHENQ